MATINTMVKLDTASPVAGVLSLDFTNSKQYTVSDVTGDDLTLSAETVIVPSTATVTTYVYMANTSTAIHVDLYSYNSATSTIGAQWGIIEKGEWSFFAVPAGSGLALTPQTDAGAVVNYVTMTKSS
jgi:hypothetical protein